MKTDSYPEFPRHLLTCSGGSISLVDGEISISLRLEPFEINGERIDEVIEFNGMKLDDDSLSSIAGSENDFPVNPDAGYVESSIYIWSAHNPIDLECIRFGQPKGDVIPASIDLHFRFAYEGEASDLQLTFDTELTMRSPGEQVAPSDGDKPPI